MKRIVVIVAGGKGLRMGGDLPKQFIPLAGKPVLMHTLELFARWDATAQLVLVLPDDHRSYWEMLCREIGCAAPHQMVSGGETRFHSVLNGLRYLRTAGLLEEPALIGVHDGVRPFVSPEVVEACFQAAEQQGAAIPMLPMIDSLREGNAEQSRPVDRTRFFAVQTPQVFQSELLWKAYEQPYSALFTDDASVVEAAGGQVRLVEGNRENIKLTTPFDRLVAEALIKSRQADRYRR
ncbi:MAG: 2-C-methyl-D-erythritol 4-phosphate cytidylyltransferase [Parabacteroides sp.]